MENRMKLSQAIYLNLILLTLIFVLTMAHASYYSASIFNFGTWFLFLFALPLAVSLALNIRNYEKELKERSK